MIAACIGLILGVALGAALLYFGGVLRGKGRFARIVGFIISIYGAILIAASLYGLTTL